MITVNEIAKKLLIFGNIEIGEGCALAAGQMVAHLRFEVKEGNFLRGFAGYGITSDAAIHDLWQKILELPKGTRFVVHAYSDNRKEYLFNKTSLEFEEIKIKSELPKANCPIPILPVKPPKQESDNDYWRRHYAGLAMQGILSRSAWGEMVPFPAAIADTSIQFADALLAALAEKEVKA